MKFQSSAAALLSAALFGGAAVAQTVQSAPFTLSVTTADGKYNGSLADACHEGAAIEGLCVNAGSSSTASSYTTYHLNTTEGQQETVPNAGIPGVLTWTLPSDNISESEGLTLFVDPSTNVGLPLFEPGYGSFYVAFDTNNLANVQSALTDTVTPPTDETSKAYYRWYVCETDFEGYTYNTVSWVLGKYPPENPSCVSATVKREFVSSA